MSNSENDSELTTTYDSVTHLFPHGADPSPTTTFSVIRTKIDLRIALTFMFLYAHKNPIKIYVSHEIQLKKYIFF